MARGSWGWGLLLLGAAAAAAVLAVTITPGAPAVLFGEADVWKAQEDGMKLSAADDIARQSLASSKAAAGKHTGAGGGFSGGLGRHMAHLERQRRRLHLEEKRYNLEAGMERTRAHLERVQAADDTQIARSDLDQALSLDKSLARMKKTAAADKVAFKSATTEVKASHEEIVALRTHAAKVAQQIRDLRGKAAKLVAKATGVEDLEEKVKDEEDVAREQLSSALVRRATRRTAYQKGRTQLKKLQKQTA